MNGSVRILTLVLGTVLLPLAAPQRAAGSAVTVPMTLDHGRVFVEVEVARPGGGVRRARAWVDTGNQELLVGRALADDLGLAHPAWTRGGPLDFVEATSSAPVIRLGGIALDTDGVTVRVRDGTRVLPGLPAEVCLPARALRRLCVVFDYPARHMTLGPPGSIAPRGAAVPCRVNPETGLLMVTATLDDRQVPLGVDTGSAGTWVSDSLTGPWRARHPHWPSATGAAGSANFFGFPQEPGGTLMRLPAVGIGRLHTYDVAVLGLDPALFRWYSAKSAAPVLGFLGANVLTRYRLTVDFPNQTTWWQGGETPGVRDLDIVGLTLHPEADSGYAVAGVVTRGDRPVVKGVEPGDRLVRVDGRDVAHATMGEVVAALRGKPGAVRRLLLAREGRRLNVLAPVVRLP